MTQTTSPRSPGIWSLDGGAGSVRPVQLERRLPSSTTEPVCLIWPGRRKRAGSDAEGAAVPSSKKRSVPNHARVISTAPQRGAIDSIALQMTVAPGAGRECCRVSRICVDGLGCRAFHGFGHRSLGSRVLTASVRSPMPTVLAAVASGIHAPPQPRSRLPSAA